ncbi:hypothetical protein ACIBHX_00880 [Nonomuraea sp. NPDC050536]|uniref:hypothetical protein n=1 Tax=Nonomuraea sp. NPDC050536 TaxID=3364366 RepID=UPI0037CA6A82
MGRTRLAFSQHGLRAAGFNADRIAEDLQRIVGSADYQGKLRWGALGLVGEPARMRHNDQRDDFVEDVRRGMTSASGMARTLAANAKGYQKVTDANLALIASDSRSPEPKVDRDEPLAGLIPRGRDLPEDVLGNDTFAPGSPHFQDTKGWQPAVLGIVAAGTLFSLPGLERRALSMKDVYSSVAARNMPTEAARIGKISARANAYFKLGGRTCVSGALTLALWMGMMTVDDESIDETLKSWRDEALQLFDVFGTSAVDTGDLLAKVWSGDAMDTADKKIRDFITAGTRLADRALAKFFGLQEAVKRLNKLYDALFALVVAEVVTMAALAVFRAGNPAASVGTELVGRRLFMAMLTARAAAVAVVMGLMYHDVGQDHDMPLVDGVPDNVQFPKFSV